MNTTLKDWSIIVLVMIIIILAFVFNGGNKIKQVPSDNIVALDSIDNVIHNLKQTIEYNERLIDSLIKIKQKTIIKYEKEISDFNNSSIVSDDSITRYIRSKIENL